MSKSKGFTLVELLVVISIIAILAVVGVTVFSGVQKSARETKRKQDLHSISLALQFFKSTYGNYPTPRDQTACGGWGSRSTSSLATNCGGDQWLTANSNFSQFMTVTPRDPKNEVYYAEDSAYTYTYWSNGTTFDLLAKLENPNDKQACINVGYWVESMGGQPANISWCINKTGGTSWWSTASADWVLVAHPSF